MSRLDDKSPARFTTRISRNIPETSNYVLKYSALLKPLRASAVEAPPTLLPHTATAPRIKVTIASSDAPG